MAGSRENTKQGLEEKSEQTLQLLCTEWKETEKTYQTGLKSFIAAVEDIMQNEEISDVDRIKAQQYLAPYKAIAENNCFKSELEDLDNLDKITKRIDEICNQVFDVQFRVSLPQYERVTSEHKSRQDFFTSWNQKYFNKARQEQYMLQSLDTGLILPVQRLPRYLMLLKEIRKNLKGGTLLTHVKDAITFLASKTTKVNTETKREELSKEITILLRDFEAVQKKLSKAQPYFYNEDYNKKLQQFNTYAQNCILTNDSDTLTELRKKMHELYLEAYLNGRYKNPINQTAKRDYLVALEKLIMDLDEIGRKTIGSDFLFGNEKLESLRNKSSSNEDLIFGSLSILQENKDNLKNTINTLYENFIVALDNYKSNSDPKIKNIQFQIMVNVYKVLDRMAGKDEQNKKFIIEEWHKPTQSGAYKEFFGNFHDKLENNFSEKNVSEALKEVLKSKVVKHTEERKHETSADAAATLEEVDNSSSSPEPSVLSATAASTTSPGTTSPSGSQSQAAATIGEEPSQVISNSSQPESPSQSSTQPRKSVSLIDGRRLSIVVDPKTRERRLSKLGEIESSAGNKVRDNAAESNEPTQGPVIGEPEQHKKSSLIHNRVKLFEEKFNQQEGSTIKKPKEKPNETLKKPDNDQKLIHK